MPVPLYLEEVERFLQVIDSARRCITDVTDLPSQAVSFVLERTAIIVCEQISNLATFYCSCIVFLAFALSTHMRASTPPLNRPPPQKKSLFLL